MPVLYPWPPNAAVCPESSCGARSIVDVAFTVRADGRVTDARLISPETGEALPASELHSFREDALNAVRAARFRPRFERGKALDTHDVRFRQIFWWYE
jgi:outer membrane biosynthesis protein TonB